jgi:hypothetical protein
MENNKDCKENDIKQLKNKVKHLEKRIFDLEKEKKEVKHISYSKTYLDVENII